MAKKYNKSTAGTFILNKNKSIHRWYSYLEGYSSLLVENILNEIGIENIHSIYDPFCGTGTTALVASNYGIPSFYSETNPFMRMVIEAKINSVRRLRESGKKSTYLLRFLNKMRAKSYQFSLEEVNWDGFEKFFDRDVLQVLLELKKDIQKVEDEDSKNVLMILLASVIVKSSKMKKQGDLRYAKPGEKKDSDKDIVKNFSSKIEEAIEDIDNLEIPVLTNTECLSEDARDAKGYDLVDCVITSPPYLNGTNYIRNTKLELKLCDFIKSEKDLPKFHSKGIIAGINNVSKRTSSDIKVPDFVQDYVDKLIPVAYDSRIPIMVAGYFRDMEQVIIKLSNLIKNNGFLVIDIGDSQFAGVHIPTHELLISLCQKYGFKLYNTEVLRKRHSKNGMVLSQRLLKFRLHKLEDHKDVFRRQAKFFIEKMPYREAPYSGRNWGHSWHSLCSYHGKLKPAIAHFLIKEFTSAGDVVLDPLCGVGTIPFEACLQGRIGIGNDLSELAFVVTKAKLEKPNLHRVEEVLEKLNTYIESNKFSEKVTKDIDKYKDFGFNGKLPEYFQEETYREILCARRFFLPITSNISPEEAMVYSALLHVLHGNRPYALSRNSHPLTPYAPKGKYIYKNVIKHISHKIQLNYSTNDFYNFVPGKAILGDYEKLQNSNLKVDDIISSPPFAGSIKFYMQNWMRLWLCGWESEDYKEAENLFLDQKQKDNFDVYKSFFKMCYKVLKPNGKVILHLGKTNKIDMADELAKRALPWFDEVYRGSEDVRKIEKHGVKDKGATIEHQYLFLIKK